MIQNNFCAFVFQNMPVALQRTPPIPFSFGTIIYAPNVYSKSFKQFHKQLRKQIPVQHTIGDNDITCLWPSLGLVLGIGNWHVQNSFLFANQSANV